MNLDKLMGQKEAAVKGLTQGVAHLFKQNKVQQCALPLLKSDVMCRTVLHITILYNTQHRPVHYIILH